MATPNIPARNGAYIFTSNDKSAIRLNYQHWVMTKLCGFLLHPSVPRTSESLRVADIGAGSGLWAIELSQELPPSAQLDAIDISPGQFPAPGWLPANVHCVEQDCFKPFRDDQLGRYDMVNVRFMLVLITPSNLEAFLENICSLLKPGGYIQWFEVHTESARAVTCVASAPTAATERLISLMKKPTPDSDTSWVSTLGETFTKQGLRLVANDRYPMTRFIQPLFCHLQILAYESMCDQLEAKGALGPAAAARAHLDEVRSEYAAGTAISQDHLCVVGQVPA